MRRTFLFLAVLIAAAALAGLAAGCATTAAAPAGDAIAKVWSGGPEQTALDLLEKVAAGKTEKVWATGWSVSASADGSAYVIGYPYTPLKMKAGDKEVRVVGGFAKLFERGQNASSANFATTFEKLSGSATAISADGSLVVVGAPGMKANDESYVFAYLRGPAGWKKEGDYPTLFGVPGAAGTRLGAKIALSGESGTTVLIGAPGENGSGRARYFIAPAGGWSTLKEGMQSGYLGAGGAKPGDEFGRSLAISRDDSTIVVGAPGRDGGKGAVFVFKKPSGGWTNTRDVFPITYAQGKPGDRFGSSVAVSKDGSLIAIGADGVEGGSGQVFVVEAGEIAAGKLNITGLPVDKNLKGIGISLDMSLDGKIVAAGAYGREYRGAFKVFRNKNDSWTKGLEISTTTANAANSAMANALLGFCLDLSDDGTRLLYGSPLQEGGAGSFSWRDLTKDASAPAVKPILDKNVFLLSQAGKELQVKIADLAAVAEKWEPGARKFYSKYNRGSLEEDVAFNLGDGQIQLAKGSQVRFFHKDNRLETFAFTLADDLDYGVGAKGTLRLKKGTELVMYGYNYFTGTLSGQPSVKPRAGGELVISDGARVTVISDEIEYVKFGKPGSYRIGGQNFSCEGEVFFWDSAKGAMLSVTLSKDQQVNTGGFKVVCPKGTALAYMKGQLMVIEAFEKELKVPFKGAAQTVKVGEGAFLDEKGQVMEIGSLK